MNCQEWISVREWRTKKYGNEQQERKYEEWKVCTKDSSSFGQKVGWLGERNRGGQVVRIINLYNDNESDNDSDNYYNKDFDHDNEYNCENMKFWSLAHLMCLTGGVLLWLSNITRRFETF